MTHHSSPSSPRPAAALWPRLAGQGLLRIGRWAGRRIPHPLQRPWLEMALNRSLATALADGDFDFLQGRVLAVEVEDLDWRWPISCCHARLVVLSRDCQAQASIRGSAAQLTRLAARQEDPDSFFFQRRLSIQGDTELALAVKNQLDAMDLNQLPPPILRLLNVLAQLADTQQPGHER